MGTWAEILNEYLLVSHTDDGKLRPNVVGTSQLQDGAVTTAKLDVPLRAKIEKVTNASVPYYAPEDYGCAKWVDASINDAAIAAAIQDAIANNGVVQFTGDGPYNVSKAIDQDVSKFVVRGNKTVLDVSDSFSGPYFWSLYSSTDYQYASNQGTALSGIILTGSGLGNPLIATTAIQIGHATYTNNSLFSVEEVYIQGFATGFKYTHNAWRIRLANSRVTGGIALAAAAGLVNFGESMLVENCMFESYNAQVTIGTGEWNFINCSFDSCSIAVVGNCAVKLQGSHLEPHTIFPCLNITHAQAMVTLDNVTLIIDPNVSINNAAFNIVSTNMTYGLIIRNLDTIQSAKYTPHVNNQNCLLVSGGGRVDMQGYSSNTNGYNYVIATSNNLLYNGDGEKGSTVGWTTYGSYGGVTTFTADNTMKKNGGYSLKLTATGGSLYVGQAVPCKPGQWLFAQCWTRTAIGALDGSSTLSLDFLSAKGDVIKTIGYTNLTKTTTWTCLRQLTGISPIAPPGTASVRVYLGVTGTDTTAWYDDIIVNVA